MLFFPFFLPRSRRLQIKLCDESDSKHTNTKSFWISKIHGELQRYLLFLMLLLEPLARQKGVAKNKDTCNPVFILRCTVNSKNGGRQQHRNQQIASFNPHIPPPCPCDETGSTTLHSAVCSPRAHFGRFRGNPNQYVKIMSHIRHTGYSGRT